VRPAERHSGADYNPTERMMASAGRPTVLVIDDDERLRALCQAALEDDYQVVLAEDGERGLRLFYERQPDLVLLDVTMPGLDGYEVCRRIREVATTPIIMLTAHGEAPQVALGLDAGADDYVTKPFRPVEMLARIRAALRRAQDLAPGGTTNKGGAASPELLSFQGGDLVVDTGRRVAIVLGKEVVLSATEYRFLEVLARNGGQVLTHDQLLERVWGHEAAGETGYLKTYVGLLRTKLEPIPGKPRFILSRRGLGYLLETRSAG
jgi:DNA-binding response OmpR family regulator